MKRIVKNIEKLHEACEPVKFITDEGVDKNEGLEIIAQLKEVMKAKPTLVALAAPQIGIKSRVFCIRFSDSIKTFINPIITKKGMPKLVCETSISFPDKQFLLTRPSELEIKYYNDEFKYEDNKLLDTAAGIFDQMYQFLDGVTPMDISLVSDIKDDGEITEAELADPEFIKTAQELYKKFVASLSKNLQAEISEDENEQKAYKQMAFSEGVVNGRIQVIEGDTAQQEAKILANKTLKQQQKNSFNTFVNKKMR